MICATTLAALSVSCLRSVHQFLYIDKDEQLYVKHFSSTTSIMERS